MKKDGKNSNNTRPTKYPLLARIFVKDKNDRQKMGKFAGTCGIVSNFLLCVAKLVAGILSGSIAVIADAVNNLSDSVASVVTLVGFKLSEKPADAEHPYGHARYEYISGFVVSCLIIVVGIQFLINSVDKIINPVEVDYSLVLWIILGVSVVVKIWQGIFYLRIARLISSDSLRATALDSRNDVLVTSVVIVGAAVAQAFGVQIDGYIGCAVALFILYSGIKLIGETLSPLLGEAPNTALVNEIRQKILGYPSVLGLHDLIVHSYGHKRCFASVHVEFAAKQDIMLSHDIIDNMERDFAADMQISLIVHLDPVVTDDPQLDSLKADVSKIVAEIFEGMEVHDFRLMKTKQQYKLIFDVDVPSLCKLSDQAIRQLVSSKVGQLQDNYTCSITLDRSYTASVQ